MKEFFVNVPWGFWPALGVEYLYAVFAVLCYMISRHYPTEGSLHRQDQELELQKKRRIGDWLLYSAYFAMAFTLAVAFCWFYPSFDGWQAVWIILTVIFLPALLIIIIVFLICWLILKF